ncbi:deoxyhypusine synthase family protein [Candidatus Woesearchaeota archaeon]|jgi:deoxyhypusine synthase|nr:deoxyhypusine synthase family protein [Candidatus Woesearchaeota archaeon]MBT3438383.1 deoxyhypusine synthase family protein [Candidatus Woesearchaeota archaeon]MBT4207608.1 deoxyhypusine synthase family protein [Candidatus Woesearchaeota archaeon]MBT5111936.1 deoxyhypusine synthase family protein [Candidatus Woesearchaeota archaeon]MBT6940918.1 deoxyhypusine synthase family protein [Candidatus Woesearchaeota archaeon]
MQKVKDFKWTKNSKTEDLVDALGNVGFQSIELKKSVDNVIKMKKNGAKIFLTFTSNMVTSGLRGFFAQLIKLGIPDVIVTTVGGLEEDIMKSQGIDFIVGDFNSNDIELNEKGINRVGNLYIPNESYIKFEDLMKPMLTEVYKKKQRIATSELLNELGSQLEDENSILYQAHKNKVPIFCPAITDGSMGFQLYMFQQDNPEFIVDVVKDFSNILFSVSQDDKKGIISLGGSISKHHAILAGVLNGGMDYAIYMTTARPTSGSMSGATTNEAKSWGKVKDDSDVVTVVGDVTINFPLMMTAALEKLSREGLIDE